ncbi:MULTISPECIES: hypothetical protein [Agrobacterium tumefaciens complex]|jgi:hypothetical protein|uniref:Transmembrane protein n=1 Tax=Agrobacterium radiobacter TaxID=362 RepID=A0ABD5LJL8_AGRRD|nr:MULTISPECIES: hypothetical protein [Agrobacterium tumefaciens complex]MCP2134423.1 hypothetical protein [Rhizobium sp. SLBN-94]TGE80289.1 hypothetical protein C9410_08545 [Rhizobium sp. SEMIA 439]EPR20103.1 hypothetical protein L902_30965 [Agrobacterium radiobacter DSM 30147]KAA1237185.1 hypothetical protein FHL81_11150 [Agrobacterium tumefaciens]KAB0462127.1 hypothetical protein F7R04_00500 [Agrobacterium tumefaciens]
MGSDRRGFRDTASAALFTLLGAFVWALCSAAAAAIGLYVRNRLETDHATDIIMLFFAGGLFGWLLAMAALHFLPPSTTLPLRFAAACLAIAFFTLAVAAAFFAFEYRIFYAQWHAPAFSRIWFFQQLFTSLGAIYQFCVLGLGLYLPFAAVPLLPAGAFLCRRAQRAT